MERMNSRTDASLIIQRVARDRHNPADRFHVSTLQLPIRYGLKNRSHSYPLLDKDVQLSLAPNTKPILAEFEKGPILGQRHMPPSCQTNDLRITIKTYSQSSNTRQSSSVRLDKGGAVM